MKTIALLGTNECAKKQKKRGDKMLNEKEPFEKGAAACNNLIFLIKKKL